MRTIFIICLLLGIFAVGGLLVLRPTLESTQPTKGETPLEYYFLPQGKIDTPTADLVTLKIGDVEIGVAADSSIAYVRQPGITAVPENCSAPKGQCWRFNGVLVYACPTSNGWLMDLGPVHDDYALAWLELQRSNFEHMMAAAHDHPVLQNYGVKNPWK